MKRLFVFIITIISLGTANAQEAEVQDGFYRIQNYGSDRFVYVCDNTGTVNTANKTADMEAIALYKSPERRYSDPASVIFVTFIAVDRGNVFLDLLAQGTGVHEIVGTYVNVTGGTAYGTYWIYNPKFSVYLWDENINNEESGYVGTTPVKKNGTTVENYRNWKVYPIDANSSEYFGIAPKTNMQLNGKYYKPFYMAYPFDFASNGMKAYYVSAVHSDAVVIKEIVGEVPAKTPVIVECSTSAATTNRLNIYPTSISEISDNQLSGNFFCYDGHQQSEASHVGYDPNTMRVLAVKDGKLKFVTDDNGDYTTPMNINGSAYTHFLNANESYLTVPAGSAAEIAVMTEAEYDATHKKKGDIDGNSVINIADVTALYKLIADGKTATETPAGDVDGNGTINIADVAALFKLIAAGS